MMARVKAANHSSQSGSSRCSSGKANPENRRRWQIAQPAQRIAHCVARIRQFIDRVSSASNSVSELAHALGNLLRAICNCCLAAG
jgi:hypothetical protein